jgi:hypothetical protein
MEKHSRNYAKNEKRLCFLPIFDRIVANSLSDKELEKLYCSDIK